MILYSVGNLVFCVVFCRILFILFHLAIALSALLRFNGFLLAVWYLQIVHTLFL